MKIRIRINSLLLLIGMVFLTSCNNSHLFDQVDSISEDGWKAKEAINFNVSLSDTSQAYNVHFHIRNYAQYEFSNLWLFVGIEAPNGSVHHDTLEIILANENGKWLGEGLGDINSMLVPYLYNVRFPNRGIYQFSIEQAMRRDPLENIIDFGLRVEEYQE